MKFRRRFFALALRQAIKGPTPVSSKRTIAHGMLTRLKMGGPMVTLRPVANSDSIGNVVSSRTVAAMPTKIMLLNRNEDSRETCLKGVWCEVVTNGSVLDMEQLKPLERFKNFQLVFSFDAADKTTFEKIRAGSNFEKILGNIDDVTQNTTIAVAAWMLLQGDNNDQVEDVIRLLARKKVKVLGIQRLLLDFDKQAEMRSLKINGRWIRQNLHNSSYSDLRALAKRHDMQLSISDSLYSRNHLCPWPWMGVFIDTSGNVVPCCKIGDASICNMGNLNEDDIEIIWKSKEYKDFRRRHKINDLPGFCRGCYTAAP